MNTDATGSASAPDPASFGAGSYRGYDTRLAAEADDELTLVGPGTPCGEYLRRYWQPVGIGAQIGELPVATRILGEELVLFRDLGGRVGLVHKRCPHRRASLEFGTCEQRGIRCCYHGWHFDVDGTLLDAPGQPQAAAERLKSHVRLGAYPAFEYKGLVFAYMGPVDLMPRFPVYDAFELPGMEMVPYKAPFHCNWLQVLDAIVDPIHTSFLHSNISRVQFSAEFGEVGEMDFFERDAWLLGANTRRVGDNVWFRVNELVLPNFTQAGAAFATDGTKQRYYGRSAFTRWVVPLDDEETVCFAWANFGERGDPQEYNTAEGPELIEQGEVFDRAYDHKQRFPADAEATEGMGRITIHDNENLAPSDKGIALMRRKLRSEIRKVAAGEKPMHVSDFAQNPVPTYGGDTVLRMPRKSNDEAEFLSRLAHALMKTQYAADGLPEAERLAMVSDRMRAIEKHGLPASTAP
ncbi:MAG: Rieske 2Fe-2S domain-containing protein [Gammaproteobacteria bacterium]